MSFDDSKKGIVEILMRRDDNTEEEAWDRVDEVQGMFDDLMGNSDPSICEADDILASELGLEPDYMECFLL